MCNKSGRHFDVQISQSRLWSISLLPASCQAKGSMALSCVMVAFNFALKIGRAGENKHMRAGVGNLEFL